MVLHHIILIFLITYFFHSELFQQTELSFEGKRQELLAGSWILFGLDYRKIYCQIMNDDTGRLFYYSLIYVSKILWGLDRKYGNIQYHSRSLINDNATTRFLDPAAFGRVRLETS
jgi:hypothetical protein